jgi:hypothetical protein
MASRQTMAAQLNTCAWNPTQDAINAISTLPLRNLLQATWDGKPVENIQAAFSNVVTNPDYLGMDFEVIAGAMAAIACLRGYNAILDFLLETSSRVALLRGMNSPIWRSAVKGIWPSIWAVLLDNDFSGGGSNPEKLIGVVNSLICTQEMNPRVADVTSLFIERGVHANGDMVEWCTTKGDAKTLKLLLFHRPAGRFSYRSNALQETALFGPTENLRAVLESGKVNVN